MVVLLVICGTVLTRGITSQIPTGTWAPAGSGTHLSGPRAGAAAVQLPDGRLFITGGDDGSGAVANADIYDTSGNFLAAAPMNAARSQHTATVLPDGTVLVAGGVGSKGGAISSGEIYNPATNAWSATGSPLVAARSGHTATVLPDGTVLLAGGDSSGTPLSSLEIYNPTDGTFAVVPGSLSSPRELHAAAALRNGDVILVGGSNGVAALATSDIYSFADGTVSAGQVMSTPREGLSAATLLDGKVLVAGGNSGSANGSQDLASAEVYDPGVGAFTATGSLATARQRHQAFLLPHNGSILIVGGSSSISGVETPVASVEMYYPQSSGQDAAPNWNGSFHAMGSMASARVSATGASPSDGTPQSRNDGLFLIAGGKDAIGSALSSSELYGFAWVKTDALDYEPGTTVNITGGGWQPGETVTLHLQEAPYFDTHADLTATVQSDGTFSNSQFAPDSHDVGIRFYLTVVGSMSGSQAQTTFTDNNVTVASAPSGVTFTLNWISYKSANCSGTVNTSGSNQINSAGVNVGVGNPASTLFEAAALSDQGGGFTNWKQGSSTLGTANPICINNPSGNYTATYSTTAVAPTLSSVSPNSGEPGQTINTITLTGTGLTANTQVSFGPGITVGATATNSNNTQLTFSISIGTGATLGGHTVSVTNAAGSGGGGGTATLTNGFTVNGRTTTTSVSCTPTSVNVGSATSCKATVTDTDSGTTSTPTGSVSFASNGSGNFTPASCTLSGTGAISTCTVSYTPSAKGSGTHTITGNYGGDSNHATSNGSFGLTVTQGTTTTALTSSVNPSAYGQSITFAATVSSGGTPITSGTGDAVTFKDGASTLGTGTVNVSGVAVFSTSSLSLGAHSVTAAFSGDSNNAGSTSTPLSQTVNRASSTTSLTVVPNSITLGQSATVSATVNPQFTGTPSGTLNVSDGLSGSGNTCTIALANGTGQCSLTPTSNGSLTVSGAYSGDGNFATGTGTAGLTVTGTPAQITSAASTTFTAGSAGAFTATATGTPTPVLSETGGLPNGVTFHDNGGGTATLAGNATVAGTYAITITAHNGVGTDATQLFTLTVNAGALASITLSPSTASIIAGGSQQYTATGFDQFHNSRGDVTGATTLSVSNGTCTANVCSSTVAGAQTVTGNDGGVIGTAALNVAAGPITHLALTPATATIAAGGSEPYTAMGVDAFGNAAGDVTGSTTFTIGAPASCAVASCGSTAAGIYTVTGIYTVNGAQGTASLTVTAGSFARLQLLAPGETAASGTASGKTGTPSTEYVNGAFNITVNAVDQYWNLVNTVTDMVQITSTDAKAVLPADAALAAGTGTFSVTPETVSYKPATTTVTVTDSSDSTKQADTSPAIQAIIVYTAGITPVQAATGQATTYTLTVSNAAAPNTNNVKSVRIAVPANGGVPGNISVVATRPDATQASWIVDQTQTGYLRVRECVTGDGCYVSGANNDIGPGGTVALQFATTADENVTSAPAQEVWNTAAFSDAQWTSALPLAPPEPTVGIGAAPSITNAAATTFTYGMAGTFKVTTNGVPKPTLTESGALPGSVSFTDNGDGTATLAGTPGAAGSYPISITAHNGYGSDAVQSFTLTVNKADQTITFAALPNKTYGDAAFTVGASGGGSGNPVTFASSTPGICTTTGANGGTVTIVAAGTCSVTASQAGNVNYNAGTDVVQSFTVNQAQLSITVTGTQVYGGTDKSFTPTKYASFVNGETVSVLKGTLSCSTDTANNSPVVGTYTVTGCSGLSDPNYSISYVSGGFTVTPAPLIATVAGTQVYGGTGQSFTPVYSGFVVGEGPGVLTGTLACTTNASASSPVLGTYTVSTCSGLIDPNYKISYVGGSYTVTPAPLTVTVTGTQVYGGTGQSFTPVYSGFVLGEESNVLTGTLACTTDAMVGSTVVGSYTVSACSGLNDANYKVSYVGGSFTVTPAPLAITVTGTQMYGGSGQSFTPSTYASFVNGETSKVLTGTLACTTNAMAGSPVLGAYTVSTCSGLSDPNYKINYVSGSFTVTPAPLAIAVNGTQVYGGANQSFTPSTYASFVNSEGPAVLSGALSCATNTTAASPVGHSYAVTSCSGLNDPNYNISYVSGTYTVTAAPLTITVTGTQVYGATGKSFAPASYATFVNNEGPGVLAGTLACTTNALNTSPVGSYAVAGCSGLSDANYNISYLSGGFTVTPAPLIVTASSGSMTYGGPAFIAVPFYAGFVSGDTTGNLTAQATCLSLATSSSPVGNYSSSCMGAADPNYTISYVGGSVIVTQGTTSITLATSVNPSTYMHLVTFTATLAPQFSGTPTGTVTFYDTVDGVPTSLGTGTLSVVNGEDIATLSTTSLQDQSPNKITAIYSGDTNFLTSSAAPLTQTVNAAPVVSLDPLSLSFGNQNVNTTSKGAPITLKNIGDAPLNISPNGIYITGDNATEFAQTNNCGSTVAAGGSCVMTVTFTPAHTGVATASLRIVDNDDDTVSAQQIVSLTGAGLSSIGGRSLYSDAIFATANSCGSLVLSGGSAVDSFNSSLGYGASRQLSGGNVGTNGNVTLNGSKSAIYGSASVPSLSTGNCSKTGVTGITSIGGAQVTGGPVQLNGLVTYPTPPAPSPSPSTTSQSISGSCPAGLAGCSNTGSKTVSLAPGQYGNLTLGAGTTAHLQRGTYNVNSLMLSGKSILYVDSGPVVVNLAGTLSGGSPAMDVTGGSIVNATGNPANLQFIYAGSRGMNLAGGSGSYATVYAPNALVNMSGGSDFYGSIVGSTVTNSGGTAIHYDSNLADIQAGNYIWFTAVVNNLKNIGSAPMNLYLNNSTISFTAGGTPYTMQVPNAVVTLNANTATAMTSYDLANSRWITSVPVGGVTGNTFVTGVGFQVPTDFPTGIQDVTVSASFTTDTPGVTLQWQWGAAVYNSSFSTTYATSGNNNLLGVNPEDGSANIHGTDAAGTPESFKNNVVFGGTGGGLTNYTGYLSTAGGVVPTLAPLSVSPGALGFGAQGQGTTSTVAQTALLTNNDADPHTISGIQIIGTNAGDFAQTNTCVGSLAPGASCSISVTFTPKGIGTRTAEIVVSDAGNTGAPTAVYLSGTGQ